MRFKFRASSAPRRLGGGCRPVELLRVASREARQQGSVDSTEAQQQSSAVGRNTSSDLIVSMVGTVASSPKVVEQLPLGALDPQEHIANLKEAAKGEQEDGAGAATNGNGNGHSSDSGSSQAAGASARSESCFFLSGVDTGHVFASGCVHERESN